MEVTLFGVLRDRLQDGLTSDTVPLVSSGPPCRVPSCLKGFFPQSSWVPREVVLDSTPDTLEGPAR